MKEIIIKDRKTGKIALQLIGGKLYCTNNIPYEVNGNCITVGLDQKVEGDLILHNNT